MKSDFSPELQAELQADLLDDFYAECDEQLANLRAQLVRLEESLAKSESNAVALESLYRSVHSFKGNAAIVGLGSAEELAHAVEGLLRGLTRRETGLTAPTLDLIGQAGHKLEQIVTTFRLKRPMPDTATLLAALRPFSTAAPPGGPSPVAIMAAPAPDQAGDYGLLAWHATFAPSAERHARGLNINVVRARLGELGRIFKAVPSIKAGGVMTFEFTLGLRAIPADLPAWAADGIVLAPDAEFASARSPAFRRNPNEPDAAPPEGGTTSAENPDGTAVAPEAAKDAPASATPFPAPDPAGNGNGHSSMFIAPSHIVRVDLGRLDELMRIAGELVIQRSRLEERIARTLGDRTELQEVNLSFGRSLRELREAITRVRLVPVSEIFTRLPFVTRDLSRESGKKVRLVLEGAEIEIDKYLVERLKEPLLHLVRNAVSHGIESPEQRRAAAKTEEATLLLRAAAIGDSVVIQIRDDGRGIDARRVAKRAAALGIAVPEQLDATAVLNLLCAPGFSTREEADRASGRGVGMAVVANTVRELGGSLSLDTSPGRWTQFTLRLPLTLSIAETFIVSASTQICAVPQGLVEEIIYISSADVRRIKQVEVVSYHSGVLPLVRLRSLFGVEPTQSPQVTVLVVGSERGSTGLVVDRVHGQREVVVRPMRDPLIHVPGISGATELGDGKPVLILDAAALTSGAVRPRTIEPAATPRNEIPLEKASA